jgi:hypothetical protein
VAYQLTLIRGRIEQRGDLDFGQLLSSHHWCLPGILKPADQPIPGQGVDRMLRLRPKVRPATVLASLYLEHRATGQENRDGFGSLRTAPDTGRKAPLNSRFVGLCVKSRRFVTSGRWRSACRAEINPGGKFTAGFLR